MLAGVPLVEPMQESAMKLDSEEAAYEDIAAIIEDLEGVLEHGMLLNVVTEAVVVGIDGPVTLTKVSSGTRMCDAILRKCYMLIARDQGIT